MKLVVFDLDETLGYFVEFGIFWDSLCLYLLKNNKEEPTQDDFNKIIALPDETKDRLKPYLAKDYQSYANTSGKSP